MKIDSYIGLGSNLEGPQQQLTGALEKIAALEECELQAVSSFYRSQPLGPQDQPDFVNAVAKLGTSLSAHDLLTCLQGIESAHQRVRERRWGPRTLDLDLLVYGDQIIDDERLRVPHIELPRRNFVLIPLYEIAEALTIPGMGSIKQLVSAVDAEGLEVLDSDERRPD